jgi:hypothetical protein
MLKLKMGLSFLCEQAAAKKDAALYAEVVLDNVPDEFLTTILSAPDFCAVLAQFTPAVLQHREWFEKLKTEVIEQMKPESEAAK